MAQPEPIITVDQLVKTYDGKNVVDSVSFEVQKGEIFGILGPNGAGKTTLVNIASTLMKPTSGTITVCGADVVSQPRQVRRHISLTGQFAAVDGELTGRENLVFFARLYGLRSKAARARADELLEQFRLSAAATQRAAKYSGGMRRRLDIAASLIVEPRLLFLDEPTTGLDPLSRRELWETVENLRDRGVSVLLTTQYLDEAERLSDDIVLIRDGNKVMQGAPAALRQQFGAPVCQIGFEAVADADRAVADVLSARLGRRTDGFTREGLTVSFTAHRGVDDLADSLEALRGAGIPTSTAALNPPSLDDVFLSMAFKSSPEEPDEV